jgi:hypothetical protein
VTGRSPFSVSCATRASKDAKGQIPQHGRHRIGRFGDARGYGCDVGAALPTPGVNGKTILMGLAKRFNSDVESFKKVVIEAKIPAQD